MLLYADSNGNVIVVNVISLYLIGTAWLLNMWPIFFYLLSAELEVPVDKKEETALFDGEK